MKCFLYEILFPNGKRYFGITNNPSRRWSEHKKDARCDKPRSVYAAIRKYGVENICFRVISEGTRENIMKAEIDSISQYKTATREGGYNIELGGYIPSAETRSKFGAACKKRWSDPGYRKHMVTVMTGRIQSQKTREKLSAALMGRQTSEETRRKMSLALRGRKKSPEQIYAMKLQFTPEVREKIGAATRGKVARNGVIERNRMGAKLSPEQVASIHLFKGRGIKKLAESYGVRGMYGYDIRARRAWPDWPLVQDRSQVRATVGILGDFIEDKDLDAAVYRYMRGTKNPSLPGVSFTQQ